MWEARSYDREKFGSHVVDGVG